MANAHANKIVINGVTKLDLTGDTVTAGSMLSGTTAHDKSGTAITGNIASRSDSGNVTLNASTTSKSYGAGYYANAHGAKVDVYDGTVT